MKRLALIAIVFLLAFSHAAAAQPPEPYTDPCDQLPLRDWPNSRGVEVQNGACVLHKASLGAAASLQDFILRFKISLQPNARLEFRYGTSMNDEYQFTITPAEAVLMNYIRFGNASSTVRDKLLAKAPLQIGPGQWVQVEFGMLAHRQWLTVDGKTVIDRKTSRFRGVAITGTGGVFLDDIQLVQSDLSVSGEQLPTYPAGLSQTWIAFLNHQYELALVHPDGSGMQVLASPLAESFPVLSSFSPDGKTLLINRGDGEQTLLSFYSMETLQPTGSEIRLPRSPQYDWMPDAQHLIVLRENHPNDVILEKINIQSGQTVGTYAVPSVIDEQPVQVRTVADLDCSPAAEFVSLEVYANLSGEDVHRAILFNLNSKETHFLPGAEKGVWSPDGRALFSRAGGLIDPQTLAFSELPGEMVKRITSYQDFPWSPNGQFIQTGTENAGNEAYAVYILDLETREVITLPLIGFGSFAPDSLHFVFSDSGRLIVRSLFDDTAELQIAAGVGPTWQPAPGMYPAEPIYPSQPTAASAELIPPVLETPQATRTTAAPPGSEAQDPVPSTDEQRGEPAPKPSRPAWPVVLLLLGLAGLAAAGSIAFLRYFRRCPACGKRNPGVDLYCMFCGALLAPPARTSTALVLLSVLSVSAMLGAAGITGLLIQPGIERPAPAQSTAGPQADQPAEPPSLFTKNTAPSSSTYPCGTLNLSRSDLLEVLKESEAREISITQVIAQAFKITPDADPTAAARQAETLMAQYAEAMQNMCTISFVSISPDRQYILASGQNYAENTGQGFWTALYDRKTYQLVWIQPIEIQPPSSGGMEWSPTGDAFAVSDSHFKEEDLIAVYETASGALISQIPASTRKGARCSLKGPEGSPFRWLNDGKHLVRKIDNAVQVLDAATGEAFSETAFDDSAMGSPYSRDDMRCFYRFAWAPDGTRFATVGASLEENDHPSYNGLKLWDAASGKLIAENPSGWANTGQISFSPAGDVLIANGRSLSLVDAQTGQVLQQINGCPVCSAPTDFLWSADGQQILIREDLTLGLYDRSSQSWKTAVLSSYAGRAYAWLDGGRHVLMAGDGYPRVVDVLTGQLSSLQEYFQSAR